MTTAQRAWWVVGIVALIAGVAFGYFALRPLPRNEEMAHPDQGYLIYDSTAAQAKRIASPPPRPGATNAAGGAVLLDSPKPNQLATSPLWVVGRAQGPWFFEGEFPVRLLDANDSLLTFASAHAQGEWTTSDLVPFALTLNFSAPTTDAGTLVLVKSNPSGLPERADSIRVPVRFR
jgi:immunoglobulin-like protein involved in spore germination